MKNYLVAAELKRPGFYHSGFETVVQAKTKADALKLAKKEADRKMIFDRHDGPKEWRAEITI